VPELVPAVLLAVWALVIAAHDAWRRRVPNLFLVLVAAPAVVAEMLNARGLLGVRPLDAGLGFLIGFLVTIGGYLVKLLGAGDVKYAALLGFLSGTVATGRILLVASLALGLMSLLALAESRLRQSPQRRLPAAVALSTGFLVQIATEFGHGF
jgi:prepilin peptidase CpaA